MRLLIEELIKERGLQKKYVAKQLGVTQDTLTNWMKNRNMIKLDQAVKLSEILNCKVDDLYERTDKTD
ncbi:helix-turn-helix domain-containing protein [Oceanobacillus sp. FSL W7-1309]|uniref:helix-turn-helix domain-containing protein n=1 Tax=Oceanobacillus sp. FSL W7-1309 TaxID=2954539 RepID=UPI0030F66814